MRIVHFSGQLEFADVTGNSNGKCEGLLGHMALKCGPLQYRQVILGFLS